MSTIISSLLGVAAVFSIFSLLVTGLMQSIRKTIRLKTHYLVERLRRLFGELKDTDRFVAALLTHPTLAGSRGAALYTTLTDPVKAGDDSAVKRAIETVLGKPGSKKLLPWSLISDLDKQTVKDIGQTVYEKIGPLVDYSLADTVNGAAFRWAPALAQATTDLETDTQKVTPFRGRLWALATAAFPEADGKASPLKTYIAAFHDEAQGSTSDAFTMVVRIMTLVLAFGVALAFNLDALRLWNDFGKADSNRIQTFAQAVTALQPQIQATASTDQITSSQIAKSLEVLSQAPLQLCLCGYPLWNPTASPLQVSTSTAAKPTDGRTDTAPSPPSTAPATSTAPPTSAAKASEATQGPVLHCPSSHPGGILLSVLALSLGAPFWFEVLRSAIDMKSSFTKDDGGKK